MTQQILNKELITGNGKIFAEFRQAKQGANYFIELTD